MNIEIRKKGEETSWEELAQLYHEAFQERLDQGMNFICSSFTPEYLEQHFNDAIILVALDKDQNDALAGVAVLRIKHDDRGNWGYFTDMGIKPSYKRCGIGSKLEAQRVAEAKANGCTYVMSDTAANAKSSVKWHYRNGFKLVELVSWPNTNYYSYNFRKQLVPDAKWSNPVYCKLQYWKSAIKCRMYKLANGEDRKSIWLDLYKKLRGIPS